MAGRIGHLHAILESHVIIEAGGSTEVRTGSVVTIRYEGDDDTEQYLLGSIEERSDDLEVISPGLGARQAMMGKKAGDTVELRDAHRRQRSPSRSSPLTDPAGPRAPTGTRGSISPAGHDVRPRARGSAGCAVPSCCCTGGPSTPTSTGSPPTPRSATRFRVVAMDHRGHGQGIRSRRRFRLADCADDVAALCDALDIESCIPVGYSMGGPIALLTWHRHRDRGRRAGPVRHVAVLRRRRARAHAVLRCSASRPAPAGSPRGSSASGSPSRLLGGRTEDTPIGRWAKLQIAQADPVAVAEAGASLGRFDARPWLADIDVPTAVVRTTLDNAVPPSRQSLLVEHDPRSPGGRRRRRPCRLRHRRGTLRPCVATRMRPRLRRGRTRLSRSHADGGNRRGRRSEDLVARRRGDDSTGDRTTAR